MFQQSPTDVKNPTIKVCEVYLIRKMEIALLLFIPILQNFWYSKRDPEIENMLPVLV